MSKKVYDFDHVHAAMCIMEEIAAPTLAGEPWQETRDQHGINALREMIVDHLAGPCNMAWDHAYKRFEAAHDSWVMATEDGTTAAGEVPGGSPGDPGGFDYEFVPFWLRTCVDWSDWRLPRVRGTTMSDAA